MVENYKIHKMVEYMKYSGFEFETLEVVESLDQILAYYGFIGVELTDSDYLLLVAELLPLAEEYEFREVAHLALEDELPLIKERLIEN